MLHELYGLSCKPKVDFWRYCLDPCCMSEDGGSPRPSETQMDVGPIAPVSPVPSTNSKGYFYLMMYG